MDSVAHRDEILKDLRLKVGGRFGDIAMRADEDSIVNRLRNAGYPRATVFPSRSVNKGDHRATVELSVVPGSLAKFGTIAVTSVSRKNTHGEIDSSVVLPTARLQDRRPVQRPRDERCEAQPVQSRDVPPRRDRCGLDVAARRQRHRRQCRSARRLSPSIRPRRGVGHARLLPRQRPVHRQELSQGRAAHRVDRARVEDRIWSSRRTFGVSAGSAGTSSTPTALAARSSTTTPARPFGGRRCSDRTGCRPTPSTPSDGANICPSCGRPIWASRRRRRATSARECRSGARTHSSTARRRRSPPCSVRCLADAPSNRSTTRSGSLVSVS